MKSGAPLSLIAELTHRCPLRCVYCSNPMELQERARELKTEQWAGLFFEAGRLGMLQAHLTGGEPLARPDLTELILQAHRAGLYTNLITSGVGLSEERLESLVGAGLDHVQLSFQDANGTEADRIAGHSAHAIKVAAAKWIRKQRVAFTINIVVHRQNLDRLETMIQMAETLGSSRLEIAHVQYYGWAFRNRETLLPTPEQVQNSRIMVDSARERLKGKMKIDYVVPDYYAELPKACMNGWGKNTIVMDPAGRAFPCHAAGIIPGLEAPVYPHVSLKWIWEESPAFQKFRGEEWMEEPCKTCPQRSKDFGGCRCQAMLLAGNPTSTDPICKYSPHRPLVDELLAKLSETRPSPTPVLIYRTNPR